MLRKHTAGPWGIGTDAYDVHTAMIHARGKPIAFVKNGVVSLERDATEQAFNAFLIAAAPDLLESLKELLPLWESGISEPWVQRARAAIAKAEGVKHG